MQRGRNERGSIGVGLLKIETAATATTHHLRREARLRPNATPALSLRTTPVNEALGAITAVLVVLAAINAIFIATTTATDARHTLASARALGATRSQISAGVVAAEFLAALPASILGIPAGIALVHAVGHGTRRTTPPTL